jgi:hypothetical protein
MECDLAVVPGKMYDRSVKDARPKGRMPRLRDDGFVASLWRRSLIYNEICAKHRILSVDGPRDRVLILYLPWAGELKLLARPARWPDGRKFTEVIRYTYHDCSLGDQIPI